MDPAGPAFMGAFLLGLFINFLLYSLEVLAIILYLIRPGRRRAYQYMILVLFLNDSFCIGSDSAYGWLALIERIPDPQKALFRWCIPISVMSSSFSAMIEQYFLIYRYRTLSKRNFVSFFFGLLVMLHVSFSLVSGISMTMDPTFTFGSNMATIALTLATVLCAFVDLVVPGALVFTLHKMKTSFHSTNGLLRRASLKFIASGLIVGLLGVSFPVLFQLRSNATPGVAIIFGRLYTLTILSNLLLTTSTRTGDHNSGIHTDGDLENSVALSDSMHVHRSAIIRVNNDSPAHRKGSLMIDSNSSGGAASKLDYAPKLKPLDTLDLGS